MYCEHFGLQQPPFKIIPDTRLFYPGGKRGLVLEALVYAISGGEGIIKVVGEVGSGKTMLCRMLAEKLPGHVDIIYLANPRLTPDTILQALALELELPIASEEHPNRLQLMQTLHNALLDKHAAGRQVVVLVEEAQSMPLDTLEEIRLLSNLETTRNKLLQMVLFGQPELDDNLAQPHIRQLKERITHSFKLAPLNATDAQEYLDFRMRAVGYRGPQVFTKSALRTLCRASKGLLRRINILADKSLLAVFAENEHLVKAKHVRRAMGDSGFIDYTAKQKMPLWLSLSGSVAAILLLVFMFKPEWYGLVPASFIPAHSAVPQNVQPPRNTMLPTREPAPEQQMVQVSQAEPPQADEAEQPVIPEAPAQEDIKPLPPPPPPQPHSLFSLLQQRLQASRDWLKQADARDYSIQVMQAQADAPETLERFFVDPDIHDLLDHLYIYRLSENHWGVVYGSFDSAGAAKAARTKLPKLLLRNRPFLLTVENIRRKAVVTATAPLQNISLQSSVPNTTAVE